MRPMIVVTLGAHVLDVLARPVESIPPGQGAALVEQIKATAAGTAGGTALTLAKLGATVHTAGAIGEDALGDLMLALLAQAGVHTDYLLRRPDVQTSATVLPIRPNGERPALHVVGANASYGVDDVPWELIASATHLHLGAPEFLGGEAAAKILAYAREHGVVTSADLLTEGNPGVLEWIAPALAHLDYLLPNAEQVCALTEIADLVPACATLLERGVGCVAATQGADGAIVVDAQSVQAVPAFPVQVVDTTGCGDAFSAGFLRGRSLGLDTHDAAVYGCAAASFVAQGLGSDHGDFDLDAVEALAVY